MNHVGRQRAHPAVVLNVEPARTPGRRTATGMKVARPSDENCAAGRFVSRVRRFLQAVREPIVGHQQEDSGGRR